MKSLVTLDKVTLILSLLLLLGIASTEVKGDDNDTISQLNEYVKSAKGFKLDSHHMCTVIRDSVKKDLKKLWPTQSHATKDNRNHPRFQKHGEDCNIKVQQNFYKELLKVAEDKSSNHRVLNKSGLEFSYGWYMRNWSRVWHTALKNDSVRKQLCNPQWLLECNPNTNQCVCRTSRIGEPFIEDTEINEEEKKYKDRYGIQYVPSNESEWVCNGGQCNLTYTSRDTYRCAVQVTHSCELFQPYFGMCVVNCQLGGDNECMGFIPKGGEDHDTLRCCKSVDECAPPETKISTGSRFADDRSNLLLSLILICVIGLGCSLNWGRVFGFTVG